MNASQHALFQWIAGLVAAAPWIIDAARAAAVGGAWVSALLVVWALWRQPHAWRYVLLSAVACGTATLLAHYTANWLGWPRPFVLGLSPAYIAHRASGSLPSAHAAAMFTLALMFRARPALRQLGNVLAVVALVTGGARVLVGVHFPMDIGAGFVLAYGVATIFGALLSWARRVAKKMAGLKSPQHASQTLPGAAP